MLCFLHNHLQEMVSCVEDALHFVGRDKCPWWTGYWSALCLWSQLLVSVYNENLNHVMVCDVQDIGQHCVCELHCFGVVYNKNLNHGMVCDAIDKLKIPCPFWCICIISSAQIVTGRFPCGNNFGVNPLLLCCLSSLSINSSNGILFMTTMLASGKLILSTTSCLRFW